MSTVQRPLPRSAFNFACELPSAALHLVHLPGARPGGPGWVPALYLLLPGPPTHLPPSLSPLLPHQAKERLHRRPETHSQEGELGSLLPRLRSEEESSWANDGKNKGKLSAGERMFPQVRWGWTVGGGGEGELGGGGVLSNQR